MFGSFFPIARFGVNAMLNGDLYNIISMSLVKYAGFYCFPFASGGNATFKYIIFWCWCDKMLP